MGEEACEMAGRAALAHLLFAVLLCTQFARGASSPEGGDLLGLTEKKLLEDQLDIPKKKAVPSEDNLLPEDSYHAFNGFLVEGSKSVVRKGKPQCEELCNRNVECRSYSFRQRDNTCVISKKSLRYNPSWEFYARGLKPDHTGKLIDSNRFHGFPGMFADGFETKHDVDKEECRETCEANPRCRSYSFRKHTKSCILSNSGVQYNPEYVYYENEQRVAENPF